jgi:hypothetical protein
MKFKRKLRDENNTSHIKKPKIDVARVCGSCNQYFKKGKINSKVLLKNYLYVAFLFPNPNYNEENRLCNSCYHACHQECVKNSPKQRERDELTAELERIALEAEQKLKKTTKERISYKS